MRLFMCFLSLLGPILHAIAERMFATNRDVLRPFVGPLTLNLTMLALLAWIAKGAYSIVFSAHNSRSFNPRTWEVKRKSCLISRVS